MAAPTLTSKSTTSVTIDWTAPTGTATGNAAITSYKLVWDDDNDGAFDELTDSPVLTYTASSLTGGSTYKFKVKATNIYGYGTFSSELSVTTSDVPSQMSAPTTSLSGTNVVVAWAEPNTNNEAIDQYEIQFKKSDGSYVIDSTNCDGADATIKTNRECTVPMIDIVSNTGLSFDTLIQVNARAHNANGWGSYSELNTAGTNIDTLPVAVGAPSVDAALSSNTEIHISWTALTADSDIGGSPITSYEV